MLELLIDFAFGIAMSMGGLGAGWLLHRALGGAASTPPEEQKVARTVLTHLRQLAAHMAANVGQHSSRVAEINQELTVREPEGPEGVVSAVARLIASNETMQSQLGEVEKKLQEQARLVEAKAVEARTDSLTGLANRRALDDKLAACCAEFQKSRRPVSLVFGDIDHFKAFNDAHGHQAGDEALQGAARVLRESVRESDFVARYGGEEIALVLPGADVGEAVRVMERARQAVQETRFRSPSERAVQEASGSHLPDRAAGGCRDGAGSAPVRTTPTSSLNVTMSFGVAELLPGESLRQWIDRADAALYTAKEAGRNRGCWNDGQKIHPVARPGDLAEKGRARDSRSALAPTKGNRAPSACTASPCSAASSAADELRMCSKSEFALYLGRRLAEWRRHGAAPALLFMKIDDFTGLIQRYGQETADIVCRSATQFLAASIRAMDLSSEYAEATYAMLLPGASSKELIQVAERLRRAVGGCVLSIGGCPIQVTVSLAAGVAIQSDTTEGILARLEEALAQAAAAGGNCTYFHAGQQSEPAQTTLQRIRATAAT